MKQKYQNLMSYLKLETLFHWDFTCIKNILTLKCDKKGCQMYRSIIKDNRVQLFSSDKWISQRIRNI